MPLQGVGDTPWLFRTLSDGMEQGVERGGNGVRAEVSNVYSHRFRSPKKNEVV